MNGYNHSVYALQTVLDGILEIRAYIRKSNDMKFALELHAQATKIFSEALEQKDYETLFQLEYVAQLFDEDIIKLRDGTPENRIDPAVTLSGLDDAWKNNQNIESLESRFHFAFKKYKNDFSGHQLKDTNFSTGISRLSAQLGVFSNGTSDKEEHIFYRTRISCLNDIRKEHQRRIDQTVAFITSKNRIR